MTARLPRRAARFASLFACLLILAPGTAHAATVTLGFSEPGRLEIEVHVAMEGRQADAQRRAMDADRDGNLSTEEVEAARARTLSMVRATAIDPPTGIVFVDGAPAQNASVIDYAVEGATGPVEGGHPLHVTWRLLRVFPVTANESHVVHLDTANRSAAGHLQATVSQVVVEAPPGYRLGDAAGLPLGVSRSDRTLTIPGGPSDWPGNDVQFVLERHDEQPPAEAAPIPLWPVVAALAAALAARRDPGSGQKTAREIR